MFILLLLIIIASGFNYFVVDGYSRKSMYALPRWDFTGALV